MQPNSCRHFTGPLRLWKANNQVDWIPEWIQAFALANAALLVHPIPRASIALSTDASDVAVRAVVEQCVASTWQPLVFFSRKLWNNKQKYSVFNQELLATRHFCFLPESSSFTVYVSHKPLTFAISKVTEPWSA